VTAQQNAPSQAGPGPAGDGSAEQSVLAELGRLIAEVTGEDDGWAAGITPASRLEGDLRMESVEWAALADRVAARYGDRADLWRYIAGLDIHQIVALTIGDLARYVAGQLAVPVVAWDTA
jgi:acyl carrier protein